jgi:glycosyltransferase involved in cell wall biosynthesis
MSAVLTTLDVASAALLAAMVLVAIANLLTAPRLERAGEIVRDVTRANKFAATTTRSPPSRTASVGVAAASVRGAGDGAGADASEAASGRISGWAEDLPLVSVLVPARNEAANLRANLPPLLASGYPRLEIIVLDDRSGDETAAVVEDLARDHPQRLRLIGGAALPDGWLGKNWACHQLAREARGDVLLFCDADVAAGPRAITRTVALLRRMHAGAVTAMPRHHFGSWAEAAVVPLIAQMPVAATLPLALVPRAAAPSLSMANGQWLAFTRAAYDRIGGHAAVRGEVLEDVHLGRAVKRAGHRLVAAVAVGDLTVRMYGGWADVRRGFGKNVYALLGGRPTSFAIGTTLFLLTAVYPLMAAFRGTPLALAPLALLIALRTAAALLFRHGWRAVLLHPLGAVLALAIAANSFRTRGRVEWRGRTVSVGRAGAGAA